MPIRAVIFDIGGVFARTEDVSGRRKWEQRLRLEQDTLAMVVWTSAISRRGEIGQATLDEIWHGIGEMFGLNAAEAKELQADFWSGGIWDVDLTEFVRALKPRYKTGVISNAWPETREFVESRAGTDTFDALLFSAEEGVAKPNRVIFERACARLGVAPQEAVFIDDVAENIEAAQAVGLQGIQFDNTSHVIDQIKRCLNGDAPLTEPAVLPSGFSMRPPTLDDLQAVTDLIAARDIAEYGAPDFALEDLRDEWQKPRFDLATDARLVVAPDGRVVGYEEVWVREPERLIGDGYVHPQFEGRGIGTFLLRWVESRAQEHVANAASDGRIVFQATCSGVDDGGRNLFTAEAYTPIRHFWRMEITLNDPPPAPEWPAGIVLRHFVPGQDDRAVHAAVDEAFGDHWGHTSSSFEEWARRLEHEDFDAELWFLALDGDQIAGVSICRYRIDVAWVSTLAVRRPWRHNGLGLALLRHSFNEFYRRGERSIGLAVDSQNLTGATRLYQRAGMHVARQYDTYAKVLRDA